MITKDVFQKANSDWLIHLKPIKDLSKSERDGQILVNSEVKMFDYDKITKDIHPPGRCPSSADALFVSESMVEFIEFKSGFKQKISKDSFNDYEAKCPQIKDEVYICTDYWNLFWKNQKHERQLLIDSIRFKAVESYVTLEKKILSNCPPIKNQRGITVRLTIVIDEDEIDNIESTLADLAGKATSKTNCFSQIKTALKRVYVQKDADNQDYFYDEINVISSTDFINRIRKV